MLIIMSTMNSYNICEKVSKKFVFIALVIKYNNGIITHNPPVVRAKITLSTRGLKSVT